MLVSRFLLSFLGFSTRYLVTREYDECLYQVKAVIVDFWSYSLRCCWPDHTFDPCPPCTITITIFPKSAMQVNTTLWPETSDATLITNFRGSLPEIKLEFQIAKGSENDGCVFEIEKEYGDNRRKLREFSGKSVGWNCHADFYVTTILDCSTTTRQVTSNGTTTNTIRTNTVKPLNSSFIMTTSPTTAMITPSKTSVLGLMQSTSPDIKEKDDSGKIQTNEGNTTAPKENARTNTMLAECLVLCSMMAVSYIVAIIIITVEIVMCYKMYERTNKFPWCKVYLKEKVATDALNADNVTTEEESTTMTSERMNNKTQSDCSVTCESENQDQNVG